MEFFAKLLLSPEGWRCSGMVVNINASCVVKGGMTFLWFTTDHNLQLLMGILATEIDC